MNPLVARLRAAAPFSEDGYLLIEAVNEIDRLERARDAALCDPVDGVTGEVVRSHTVTVVEVVASGFDFTGCSSNNPNVCACSTWAEVMCPLCDDPICDGQLIQMATYPTIHSVDYDSADQEWEADSWHSACEATK